MRFETADLMEDADAPTVETPAPPDLVDPTTGEVIDRGDADSLIDAFERIKAADAELYAAKTEVVRALAALTTGEAKTRRVAGQRRLVALEFPSPEFTNSILKEAWHAFPKFAPIYLRIGTVEPVAKEVKKLRETSGPSDLEMFKKLVLGAERPSTRNPSIKIEK